MTIKNASICAPAGKLSAGGICSRLTSPDTNDLSFNELLDMLEPQPERMCVPVPNFTVCADDQAHGTPVKIPARGAAMILSSEDFDVIITELATACRELGARCSYAARQVLKTKVH